MIGEHIDYTLFGCFPTAIERDILIACAPRTIPKPSSARSDAQPYDVPGSVVAENIDGKYPRQVFAPTRKSPVGDTTSGKGVSEEWDLGINTEQLRWESYVKAGYYVSVGPYFLLAE